MKVYDLEKPFFVIGCEYVCKSAACVANVSAEGRKFASTDRSILRSLPRRLRDEFPAYIMQGNGGLGSGPQVWNWQATGVSRSLWNMVKGCLKTGMSRDAILIIFRSIQNGAPNEQVQVEEEEEAEEEDELEQEQPAPQTSTPAVAQPAAPAPTNDAKENVCFSLSTCVIMSNLFTIRVLQTLRTLTTMLGRLIAPSWNTAPTLNRTMHKLAPVHLLVVPP
jgi:hypothetical protein